MPGSISMRSTGEVPAACEVIFEMASTLNLPLRERDASADA
jgi:hypothetical protein